MTPADCGYLIDREQALEMASSGICSGLGKKP